MGAQHANTVAAVVFDMDGVLVESEHLWEEMWTRYTARHGYEWGPRDTTTVQGMSAPEWAAYLAEVTATSDSVELVERTVVDDMVEALSAGRIDLLDGARDMVVEVSSRVPIALASSAPRRLIDAVLAGNGLTDRFTATVSSAEVPQGKPNPDVYEQAARRLGVVGARCAAVEDSSNGLRAAHAAGMTVIAIPNPTYPPKPDAVDKASVVATTLDGVRRSLLELTPSVMDQESA
ncbi:HAD superfamily hydrolase (TIGR01509 family) [Saccharopolyspora lacisalsi]|uniref:HAD superfamily hydrolase (TIGR01509 family) n=1 Tax=Halosaccharopolyspora lacisalsi TaxID=1000566 RepID=A0A839E504_9PSEU|nr:HAD family phosphatase [Halosaccharopolyspora lacisalsi]MBA8825988.1 HAD superfamily hydrolase (TIGR01509 family) [Halosaccharopolyspora lacisalsi]